MIERITNQSNMREKAKYIFKILEELNPGIFINADEVFYSISNKIGSLQAENKLKNGMFISSGMIRVQYNDTTCNFDILIDPCMTFP